MSFISASIEVDVLGRLQEAGLLDEQHRRVFVTQAFSLMVETPDIDFIGNPRTRALFTQEEFEEVLERIRSTILPRMDVYISDWEHQCDEDRDPESHFAPLIEGLMAMKREFGGNKEVEAELECAKRDIDQAIESVRARYPPRGDDDPGSGALGDRREIGSSEGRSVFDDVDA